MEIGVALLLGFMAGFPGAIKLISDVLEHIKDRENGTKINTGALQLKANAPQELQ